MLHADAIVLGSPVYMSSMAAEVKALIDKTQLECVGYPTNAFRNKVGGAFATGGHVRHFCCLPATACLHICFWAGQCWQGHHAHQYFARFNGVAHDRDWKRGRCLWRRCASSAISSQVAHLFYLSQRRRTLMEHSLQTLPTAKSQTHIRLEGKQIAVACIHACDCLPMNAGVWLRWWSS